MNHPSYSIPPEPQTPMADNPSIPKSTESSIQEQAIEAGSQAGKRMLDQTWDEGKKNLVKNLENISGTVRRVGDELRRNENPTLAEYVQMMAGKADTFSQYLQNKEINSLLRDSESYARRNPEIFLAGAFLFGFLGGRFLKSQPQPGKP